MIEELKLLVNGDVSAPMMDELMGFSWTAVEPGEVAMEMEASERHANAMGTLHGGVLCSMADACMSSAFASTLDKEESFALLELKINYLKPVWISRLKAIGTVVKRGETIGLVECEIRDEKQSLVAKAAGTCMVLRNEKALGRKSVLKTG